MSLVLRSALAFVLLLSAAVLHFSVPTGHPQLKVDHDQVYFEKRPFTGLIYGFHRNRRLRLFSMVLFGRRVGSSYQWYGNGALHAVFPYAKGLPHGAWKLWYPNGKVKSLRYYALGKNIGESWSWHPNGQLSDYRYFQEGEPIVAQAFIADGKPYYNFVRRDQERIGLIGGDYCKVKQKRPY